jgi:hypothetical protein
MEVSSPRVKALAVTAGFTFWFFVITSASGLFSLELLGIFLIFVITLTQIFAIKLSKGLDIFAIVNTKIFLGILFIFVISIYGIIFKILRIDVLRIKKQKSSYWLDIEKVKQSTSETQF